MASIEGVRENAKRNLNHAITTLQTIPESVYGRDDAIRTTTEVRDSIASLDLEAYHDLKEQKEPTAEAFDNPVNEAIKRITGSSILDLPHDFKNILEPEINTKTPNKAIIRAVANAKKYLRSAYWDLRRMQSGWLRFWLGSGVFLILFATAVLYAIGYFAFISAGVADPISVEGATEVLARAKTSAHDLKNMLDDASDVIDAAINLVKKLTELVSKVPALLAALGVGYAAFRKIITRSAAGIK